MKAIKKRAISLLLTFAMIIGMLPVMSTEANAIDMSPFNKVVALNVDTYFQTTNYTCSAASALTVLRYFGKATDVSDTVVQNTTNTYVYGITNAINKYMGNTYKHKDTYDQNTFYNVIYKSLSTGNPVVARLSLNQSDRNYFNYTYGTGGHYVVIVGIYKDGSGGTWFEIRDPFGNRFGSKTYCESHTGKVMVPLAEMFKYCRKYWTEAAWLNYSETPRCSYAISHNGNHDWKTVKGSNGRYDAACTVCGFIYDYNATYTTNEAGTYQILNNRFRSDPYQDSPGICLTGKTVQISGYVINPYSNHKWYKTTSGYYIYSENVKKIADPPPPSTLAINPTNTSITITQGNDCTILGSITSNYNITEVTAKLDGKPYASFKPKSTSVVLNSCAVNSKLDGTKLSTGDHTVVITATDGKATASKTINIRVNTPQKPQCAAPSITYSDVPGGKLVTITQSTSGATLHYSFSGISSYNNVSTTNASVSLAVDQYTEVSAYSTKSGMRDSERANRTIQVTQLAAPSFSVEKTGSNALVTVSTNESAKVRYSLDGSTYHDYNGSPIELTSSGTVYAYAIRNGYRDSTTVSQYVELTAPSAPVISLSVNSSKVAQDTAVMVSWDKVSNALTYTAKLYKDGKLYDTRTGITDTNATFILEDAADYSFTVSAHNKFGDSDEIRSATVTAVAPLTVRFVDWDGSILSEQKVEYGASATTPPDPERTGHYFQRWNQPYSFVTEDLTITPEYEAITYTVNYLNADGERIKTEYVTYGNSANPPPVNELVPPTESFAFTGWSISAESASSKCSLDFIDSNMTVQAVFNWANAELPVTITSVDAKWDGSNYYTVAVDMENIPDKVTTALLRVSLKTSEDKMVKTESRTVQLAPGATDQVSISLNYTGVASVAEAIVLGYDGDYLTGSTYSKAVTAPVTAVSDYAYGNWSEWSTTAPAKQDGREIETKTQYRYQTKSTTTSTSSSLDGWTQYGEPALSYTPWGSESAWVSTMPTESDTLQITNTQTVTDRAAYTLYNYYHYYGYNSSGVLYNSYGNGYWKNYEETSSTSPFPYYQTFDTYYPAYLAKVSGKHGQLWWLGSTTTVPAETHTEWKYQTRSQYYTYNYFKWSDWSVWQDAALTATSERNIETQTLYRYRDQDVPVYGSVPKDLEDKSGEVYEFSGILPVDTTADLSGKAATVMVYKGKNSDPNESQLQYVGQIEIGSNNSYAIRFKTKEAPSISSGDYVVAMSLEGSTGLINTEIIEAPVPKYTVKFLSSIDGSVIATRENVSEGSTVAMPAAPAIEGYRFVTWDHSGTNIRGDANIGTISITAHYVPNTYAVAFVDHINDEVLLFASEYGTKLSDLAARIGTPAAEGHVFKGWDYKANQTVTENTVVSAVYQPKVYTVTFYNSDYSILNKQQVPYGESATLPEAPEVEGKTFLGWSTDEMWWNVRENLDVYPLYIFTESAMKPESDVGNTYVGEDVTITLTAEDGATIYYTLDGSEPSTSAYEYTGPFTLTEDAVVRAISIVPNKNESEMLEVSFTYSDEDLDSATLPEAVEIGTYNIMAEPGKETTIQVKLDENPGLTGYLFMIECDRSAFYIDYDDESGYIVESGNVTSNGTTFCAPYGETGWQVLWFSEKASSATGSLFTLTLKAADEAEAKTYPVKISYSPANTVTSNAVEASSDSMNILLSGSTALLGDVNGDGYITTVDVVRIARYIIDDLTLTRSQLAAADVTGDGKVTAADVIRLARYIVNLAELG